MSRAVYRGSAGRSREAVVLAGGFGTRLAHVVSDVCKPMAPVSGEPFLRRILDQLDAAGFARVVIADGYRREQIEQYFAGTYRGLEVDYSSEESPLLTGGAVKKALSICTRSEVFVLNGDTWLDVDFVAMEEMLSAHPDASCCIAVKRMFSFDRYGTLEVDEDGAVRSFREKAPCADGLINGGTYLIRRDTLEHEPNVFSLENDWFSHVVSDGALFACVTDGSFIDIGVPEDYKRAQAMFLNAGDSHRLAFFDRDGTINVDTGHMHRIADCEFIEPTVEIMRRYSEDPSWRVAVVTNQAGIAKGMYSLADMRLLHRQMAEQLLERGVRVDAWYFCPHHPDFTGECACRKPRPGMLQRAMRDYRADPAQCVMYGDTDKDARAAGAAGVGFETVAGGHRRPRFSIVMPVCNTSRFLGDSVASVAGQTNGDWELVLVDDGSTDGSSEMCDDLAAEYGERIKVIHQPNAGPLAARRAGLKAAGGEILMTLDSDDALRLDALEVVASAFDRHGVDMVVYGYSRDLDFSSSEGCLFERNAILTRDELVRVVCSSNSLNAMWAKAVSRSIVDIDADYSRFIGMSYAEDLLQSLPIIDTADAAFCINEPLYFYRPNEGSLTHVFKSSHIDAVETAFKRLRDYADRWSSELGDASLAVSVAASFLDTCACLAQNAVEGLPAGEASIALRRIGDVPLFGEACSIPGALSLLRRDRRLVVGLLREHPTAAICPLKAKLLFKRAVKRLKLR